MSKPQELQITISYKTVIKVLALVLVWLLFLAAIRKASHALLLIFTALFLSLALNAPVNWIAHKLPGKRKGSRKLATALSFSVVVLVLAGFIASVVPPLVQQTTNFIESAPAVVESVQDENSALGSFVREHNLQDQVSKLSSELSERAGSISGSAFSGITMVTGSVVSVLTVLVITFMMLIEGPRWLKLGKGLLPQKRRAHVEALANDMYRVIKGYVNGQVVLAAIAAIMILVPMLILGINSPIALMVIVFICGLIPMVGHFIGAAIVTLVALFTSPIAAIILLAYYILYQQIENYVVQPRIQANATNMSPLLVFMSVIVGVNFGGLLGGLVAIPVAGSLRILVIDYLHRRDMLPKKVVDEALVESK